MSLKASDRLFANFLIKLLLIIAILASGVVLFVTNKEGSVDINQRTQRVTDLIQIGEALQKTNYAYLNYLENDTTILLDSLKAQLLDLSKKKDILTTFKKESESYTAELTTIEGALGEEYAFYADQVAFFTQKTNGMMLDDVVVKAVGKTQPLLAKQIAAERDDFKFRIAQDSVFFNGLAMTLIATSSILMILTIMMYRSSRKTVNEQESYEEEINIAKQVTLSVNKAKAEYLAMISHEIRTPMNGVLGMSNLLLQGSLTVEQQDYAKTIHDSAETLLKIVNDVLDFSKIDSGEIYLNQASADLRQIIAGVFAKLPPADPKVEVSYTVDKNIPNFINCDSVRLGQVLYNFLANAVKFTQEGTITLDCKIIDKDENGRMRLGFVIKDTGIGIADEKTKILFKPFVQVADKESRKYGGAGLGLNIAYRLITMMNGKVKVKSELGVGSVFTFYIVTQENIAKPKVETAAKASGQTSLDNDLSTVYPFNILVVDDNEINLMLISRTLSKLGYECKKCTNGQMAVDAAKEEQFDLIFMDMQMPIMDGTIATTEIRKHYRVYEYPVVIALTANALGDGRDKCLEAGMQDFIAKPFKPAEIEEIIKKWAPKVIEYRNKHHA